MVFPVDFRSVDDCGKSRLSYGGSFALRIGRFFLVKLLSFSMRDDLSRGDGHLHRQSESELCDGVHLCINVTAENIRDENLDND